MVQGKWYVTINTPMGERSGVLELHVQGKALTGSLSDGEHVVAITDGKVDGNNLRWQAKITKPMRLSFKFTAMVEGDRISGAARHMLGTATFSGTRA
jgi:aerobic carbon-monoxide dehydrogenase large subunit